MVIDVETEEVQEPVADAPEVVEGSTTPDPETPAADDAPEPEPDPIEAIFSDPDKRAAIHQRYLESEEHKAILAKERADGENTGAQRKEAELRRQAGQGEHVARVTYETLRRWEEANGRTFDPGLLDQKALRAIQNAIATPTQFNRAVEAETIYAALDQWFAGEDLSPEIRQQAAELRNSSGDRFAYLNKLREGLLEGSEAKFEAEYETRAQKHATKAAAEERKALGQELSRRGLDLDELLARPAYNPPPSTSRGGGGAKAMTSAELDAIPTNEWLLKPQKVRDELLAAAPEADRLAAKT